MTSLGVLCCFALFVCLTLLASFILSFRKCMCAYLSVVRGTLLQGLNNELPICICMCMYNGMLPDACIYIVAVIGNIVISLLSQVLCSKDYTLILGMPGTGQSS